MRLQVNGKQIDTGDALRGHVMQRLEETTDKYVGRATEAVVTFSKDAHEFVCDASVHLSTGMQSQAKARSTDVYAAFDSAADKIEKQLRRHKRRLKNHHKDRTDPIETIGMPSYVLAPLADDQDREPEDLKPMIIAETQTKLPTLSVGDAVMQMELNHAHLLVFRDPSHGRVNVVYTRDDGNIGWVDPQFSA
ncbi:MAG: ribosome-associated translation inhibitor RaiA [Pseudomonadota bacterium]